MLKVERETGKYTYIILPQINSIYLLMGATDVAVNTEQEYWFDMPLLSSLLLSLYSHNHTNKWKCFWKWRTIREYLLASRILYILYMTRLKSSKQTHSPFVLPHLNWEMWHTWTYKHTCLWVREKRFFEIWN